jgi:hypothetical protein
LPESFLLLQPELFTAAIVGTSYRALVLRVSIITQRFLKSSTFFGHPIGMKTTPSVT